MDGAELRPRETEGAAPGARLQPGGGRADTEPEAAGTGRVPPPAQEGAAGARAGKDFTAEQTPQTLSRTVGGTPTANPASQHAGASAEGAGSRDRQTDGNGVGGAVGDCGGSYSDKSYRGGQSPSPPGLQATCFRRGSESSMEDALSDARGDRGPLPPELQEDRCLARAPCRTRASPVCCSERTPGQGKTDPNAGGPHPEPRGRAPLSRDRQLCARPSQAGQQGAPLSWEWGEGLLAHGGPVYGGPEPRHGQSASRRVAAGSATGRPGGRVRAGRSLGSPHAADPSNPSSLRSGTAPRRCAWKPAEALQLRRGLRRGLWQRQAQLPGFGCAAALPDSRSGDREAPGTARLAPPGDEPQQCSRTGRRAEPPGQPGKRPAWGRSAAGPAVRLREAGQPGRPPGGRLSGGLQLRRSGGPTQSRTHARDRLLPDIRVTGRSTDRDSPPHPPSHTGVGVQESGPSSQGAALTVTPAGTAPAQPPLQLLAGEVSGGQEPVAQGASLGPGSGPERTVRQVTAEAAPAPRSPTGSREAREPQAGTLSVSKWDRLQVVGVRATGAPSSVPPPPARGLCCGAYVCTMVHARLSHRERALLIRMQCGHGHAGGDADEERSAGESPPERGGGGGASWWPEPPPRCAVERRAQPQAPDGRSRPRGSPCPGSHGVTSPRGAAEAG
ncbi:dapper homolog 3-like [Phyllostomus discolor]|uniref:Dapper homolog 3-like n=1 Tax=Phyllostomus discolor TaxID=89673 RepID=A0A6J2N9D5_9CHIR|nr:dapper homolog 3-like [Phyllostomus discolor]